jgi:hypothetical protein
MLTRNEIDDFLKKARKRGERTLSLLGKYQEFIKALSTPIGNELLSDLITKHEILLDKISNLNATDEEKMMYKVVRELILVWSTRIANFNEAVNSIKKGE